jgi:hypothetical protein
MIKMKPRAQWVERGWREGIEGWERWKKE